MSTRISNSRRRRNFKVTLFEIQKGKCARCQQPVGLHHILQCEGWVLCPLGYYLHPPKGSDAKPVRLATLEHIVPACRGGKAVLDNMLLYCRTCNESHGSHTKV